MTESFIREPEYQIPALLMGANCYECRARDVCPAMELSKEIKVLSLELATDGISDAVKDRVQGEIFAYGIKRLERDVTDIQVGISSCKGAVKVEGVKHDKTEFLYPSFNDVARAELEVVDTPEELTKKGFIVDVDEEVGRVEGITDSSATIDLNKIGFYPLYSSGLRGQIREFRNAASFRSKA